MRSRASETVRQRIRDQVLDVVLGTVHVIFEVGESKLSLNHPEFSKVSRCMGVLSTKAGSKVVDVGEADAVVLQGELPAHGQKRWFLEEVLRVG